tara:strand:+ start:1758 stop:2417 length:660 start_codon:yes stop_codon:yes gene_type:complete
MSLILNIETSSKNCSVSLSIEGNLLSNFDIEEDKYRHSELLTTSIKDILDQNNYSVKDLSAVAVGIGPGSFTGLRIGFSVAKGLCYPHNIKLIGISSLKILANSINQNFREVISLVKDKGEFFYITKFDNELNETSKPKIEKIDNRFLSQYTDNSYCIVVNSKDSLEYIKSSTDSEIEITRQSISSINMIDLSYKSFQEKRFEDLAYFEPFYIKKPYVY